MARLSGTQRLDRRTIQQLFSRWYRETPGVSSMESGRAERLLAHRGLDQFPRGPGGRGLKGQRTSVPKALRTNKKTCFSGNHEKPVTECPTENPKRPYELDVLLYGHILLTPKRNRRQSKHDGHVIPEKVWSLLPGTL